MKKLTLFFIFILSTGSIGAATVDNPLPGAGDPLAALEIYANAGGEMYFFDTVDLEDAQSLANKAGVDNQQTFDFTGRRLRMNYKLDPVFLFSGEVYGRWKFLSFESAFKTDGAISGGGEIKSGGDAAPELTKDEPCPKF